MPIVGGIYALRRRRWGLALTGSILTLLSSVILGIYGIIIILFGSMDNPSVKPSDLTPLVIGFIVGVTILAILGILTIIFVNMGKREFT
jgi:surface polysaccharide O-acyltransferase-like enzyme